LSNYKDQEDFNEGINWILNNDDKNLLNNCLKVTKEKFDSRLIANKYLDIYKSLS